MPGPIGAPVNPQAQARARTTPLGDLTTGANAGPFRVAIQEIEMRTTSQGKPFLWLRVADRSATREARCFDVAEGADELAVGTAVELRNINYNERFGVEFRPGDCRALAPGEYAPQEFVRALAAEHVERLWNEFHGFLDSIKNPALQALRQTIWGDPERAAKYKWHVSAVGHHHNYLGGNLQHVVGIMRVVEAVAAGYPLIDRDVVLFGAAVHDLGKLVEYEVDTTIRVTDEGKLRGHLVIGAQWLAELIEETRRAGNVFPRTLEDHLVHLILSHHGRGAWGSPKPPATPEAMLLHLADYVDSQTQGFLQNVEENQSQPDGWYRYFDRDIGESRNIKVRWDEPQAD